ncbi:hypothetical protein PUN28_012021 [Cardiocondyla obscurior]|uniref:Uncharacterized protein n=1 Tax=Cardiocondyla obscurior TaxID=286306 RepID=A0AAW2FDV1_9HYME
MRLSIFRLSFPPSRVLAILIRRRDARRAVGRDRSGPVRPFPRLFFVRLPPPPPTRFTPVVFSSHPRIFNPRYPSCPPSRPSRMYTRAHSLQSPLVYRVFAASATLSTRADEPSNIESGGLSTRMLLPRGSASCLLRKSAFHCYFRDPSAVLLPPRVSLSLSFSFSLASYRRIPRGREGFSPRAVINGRAVRSLESLPLNFLKPMIFIIAFSQMPFVYDTRQPARFVIPVSARNEPRKFTRHYVRLLNADSLLFDHYADHRNLLARYPHGG